MIARMHRPTRRLAQLYAGLVLYGASMALQIRAGLGLDPWDVFHQGVADRTGLSFGTVVVITGAVVLLAWVPLRQRPGIGTVSNVFVIGVAVDASLALLPAAGSTPVALAMLLAGVGLNGVASGAYIGAGPRPGAARRADDGPRPPHRRLGAHRADLDRGHRAGGRRGARRHGRPGDGALRALDRPARRTSCCRA